MKHGVTLDTGALIELESKSAFSRKLRRIRELGFVVTVPAVVLAEWWRDGFGRRHEEILGSMQIEPTSTRVAKSAGVALTKVPPDVSVVDAIVMASAAFRNDVVYTSDLGDLGKLQVHFSGVRVMSASAPGRG